MGLLRVFREGGRRNLLCGKDRPWALGTANLFDDLREKKTAGSGESRVA